MSQQSGRQHETKSARNDPHNSLFVEAHHTILPLNPKRPNETTGYNNPSDHDDSHHYLCLLTGILVGMGNRNLTAQLNFAHPQPVELD
ncbi:MAG: hypothetical protein K2P51_04080 [Rhabdochlamydiaceae bacterium]|nr:hypothetical protein [Rhabdochlamydiaceae bacterium]